MQTKAVIFNTILLFILAGIFFICSTFLCVKQTEQGIKNWRTFEAETPLDLDNDYSGDYTPILPLKAIFFTTGVKGYIWFASIFTLFFFSLRSLWKFIKCQKVAPWELELILVLSIIVVNLSLLSHFFCYNRLYQYEAVPASYQILLKLSLHSMVVFSTLTSSVTLPIYFIGRTINTKVLGSKKGTSSNSSE